VNEVPVSTLGDVVEAGAPLVTIVPAGEELIVEALVLNKDVAQIAPGLHAAIKLEAYPFTRRGFLECVEESVSPDAVADERRGLVFPAGVRVTKAALRDVGLRALSPGMTAQVEIRTGTRSVLSYLLSPIAKATSEAGRGAMAIKAAAKSQIKCRILPLFIVSSLLAGCYSPYPSSTPSDPCPGISLDRARLLNIAMSEVVRPDSSFVNKGCLPYSSIQEFQTKNKDCCYVRAVDEAPRPGTQLSLPLDRMMDYIVYIEGVCVSPGQNSSKLQLEYGMNKCGIITAIGGGVKVKINEESQ
jgi:hypothetical protein